MSKVSKHLDYALVEDVRPAMYKAMKYWGKKPHNIWYDFIDNYCPKNGVVLDPFMGSGLVAFESLIAGRKAITLDVNPLSTFFIDTLLCDFNKESFKNAVNKIVNEIEKDDIYVKHYIRKVNDEILDVYNYIWYENKVTTVRVKTHDEKERPDIMAGDYDKELLCSFDDIELKYWYPTDKLPLTPSINQKFIEDLGGDDFSKLWTKRNLYILSKIFDLILKEKDENKNALLLAFIHTLHLTCRMVYPRTEKGNRKYSGSWGRADYMIRKKSMEQNPLIVFKRSCFDKQGVEKALINAGERLPKKSKVNEIGNGSAIKSNYGLNYGIVDVADLCDYVAEKSVDFIITDPPYGGLVQYMDLSQIWLVWLQKYNEKYRANSQAEITVKRGYVDRNEYRRKLVNAFKNLHKVLKDDGYMVVTFHSQEMKEWNDFVNSVRNAGFKFDKVTHQYNKRSGESNVSNPYGTTGSDFYIRCVKQRDVDFTNDQSELEHFILNKTIEIVASRTEKTPFTFIVNGLLPEMLQAGHLRPEEPTKELHSILDKYVGNDKIFEVTHNPSKGAGDFWWFNNPREYINFPNISLSDRVEEAILSLMRRKVSVKYDDVVAEVFRLYPNGLTPDPKGIRNTLEKYAVPISGKWKLKEDVIQEATKHTEMIAHLSKIGKKNQYQIFIGKREQSEMLNHKQKLKDIADITDTTTAFAHKLEKERIERINMIDQIWFDGCDVKCIFEVENSTNFTMALQRASNLDKDIPKIMIIPDKRESELLSVNDPVFLELFREYNWHYLTYTSVVRSSASRKVELSSFLKNAKKL